MADDQFPASGNWWESARNMRFESGGSQSSSSGITNFSWQQQQHEMVFHDSAATASGNDPPPNLHMMGLGLSSQAMDWNNHQASLLRGEKASETSFRSMLQENLSSTSTNFHQQANNRGFSLDQTQSFSPQYSSGDSNVTSQGLHSTFQLDHSSAALYGNTSNSMLQGLFGGPESNNNNNNNNQTQQGSFVENNRALSFPYSTTTTTSYRLNSNNNNNNNSEYLPPCDWSKVPQFLRASPPKQQPLHNSNNSQLHFTNNAPFWNASEASSNIKDARSSFFSSLQPSFSTPNFDVQSKNTSEVRDSSAVMKKSGSEQAPKRARNEAPSPLPAFKVRKEKMGDRITALQQLVSPFGKTDTASVLSEAIEYIKFLHEQVTVLSTPYMKSTGAPTQHQQNSGKSKEAEGPKQDLRSRGLCLVPVSSTFPVTHEPTVDFWTPTFGGTYR